MLLLADCAEQVAQVATSTIDASDTDKHATETVHPKTYNYVAANSEKEKAVDSMPSFEKYRDTRSIDIDCRYSLAERNIASESKDSINNYYTHDHVGDTKTGQKLCVHSHDSDQAHLTLYNDISHNLLQKQNGSNDSKDDNRYDKKLNQPNIKPSISNVFNSLNEYINAPTGSLDYVEPILDETDDLPKTSIDNIEEKDLRPSRSVMIECSTSKTKGFVDITGTNILDYKNVLPVEVGNLVGMETINKQDNSVQNIILHSASMQCEKNSNSNVISETVNTTNSRYERDNVTADTELSNNKVGVNEQFTINENRSDKVPENISGKQKQLDAERQDPIDKCTFDENKESTIESITTKLDTNIVNKTENENVKATNNTSSIMRTTINVSDDFSEEELNRYLLELEEEERLKEEATLCADTSLIKLYNESSDGTAKIASQHQRDNEDIKEALIFEKITIGELPKISGEEFQEKEVKKFPTIDYNTGVCNKNAMDVSAGKKDLQELNDTVKVASDEKYDQSRNTQDNELGKTVKDNDVTKTAGQHMETQENTSRTVPNAVVEENKVPSKPENAGEQSSHSVNMMQKLQQNIDIDTQSQDNSDDAVKNKEPENKEVHDNKDCDIIESDKENVLIMHDNEMHNSSKTSKAEVVAKVTDACTVSDTDENSQEAEKPTRPQTLDIVSTHNKDDSHTLGKLLKHTGNV